MSDKKFEIEMLNFDELDVEELERRLELAAGSGISPDSWCINNCEDLCGVDGDVCVGECPEACADCASLCAADCITDGCGGGTYIP